MNSLLKYFLIITNMWMIQLIKVKIVELLCSSTRIIIEQLYKPNLSISKLELFCYCTKLNKKKKKIGTPEYKLVSSEFLRVHKNTVICKFILLIFNIIILSFLYRKCNTI